MLQISISKKNTRTLLRGGVWVYSDEVEAVRGEADGDLCAVLSNKDVYLGIGFYNEKSKIRVRLLSTQKDISINTEWWRNKLQRAWQLRQKQGYETCCRLVFGEADMMPGLVIDKFENNFVIQIYAAGFEHRLAIIVTLLKEMFGDSIGIYERNDMQIRTLEGLELRRGFITPFANPFMITENGVKYWIDVEQGQKTGHFLDQRENRLMLKNIVKGKEVMECFCYTGSFSIIAAKYGARKVTGLDISPYAVATAQKNAIENKVDNICEFTQGDTFDALKQWLAAGKKFDVVILDPPAFTKNKNALHNALVGYKEINQKAMRLVKNGGYLITASCSQLVRPDMFEELIHDAAAEAHVRLRHIRNLKQAGDHPYMMSISETLYLKGFIVQVVYKD